MIKDREENRIGGTPGFRWLEIVQEWFLYFMFYSIFGWCYEVFLEVVIYRWGFSNRGVLFGPYCVVYGFGALLIIFALERLKKRRVCLGRINITPVLAFIGIVFITTAVELAASYLMEWTRGSWMWDYTRFGFNFQGRIALNPSLRFGVGGMIFLYILQPFFCSLTGRMGKKSVAVCSGLLALFVLGDVLMTFVL